MKPEDYVGLTKKSAQDKAEKRNMVFRLIRIDAENFFAYPEVSDTRADRVCIEIDQGKVTRATFQ